MKKMRLGKKTLLYPMPVVLVGANVNGKANYVTIAYCGIIHPKPPMVSFVSHKGHYTNAGIKENETFSVNIPSEAMVGVTDFVGINSGKDIDKSILFENFYGVLGTAPMISECPVNLECQLSKTIDFGGIGEIFIGEIVETYSEEKYLTNGVPNIKKINPIVFSMYDKNYWKVGDHLGQAWTIGKQFRPSRD